MCCNFSMQPSVWAAAAGSRAARFGWPVPHVCLARHTARTSAVKGMDGAHWAGTCRSYRPNAPEGRGTAQRRMQLSSNGQACSITGRKPARANRSMRNLPPIAAGAWAALGQRRECGTGGDRDRRKRRGLLMRRSRGDLRKAKHPARAQGLLIARAVVTKNFSHRRRGRRGGCGVDAARWARFIFGAARYEHASIARSFASRRWAGRPFALCSHAAWLGAEEVRRATSKPAPGAPWSLIPSCR